MIDKAIFGEPFVADELKIFRELTGRDEAPTEPVREAGWYLGARLVRTLRRRPIAPTSQQLARRFMATGVA